MQQNIIEQYQREVDILLRTVSLATSQIPNLEIITLKELQSLYSYLLQHFDRENLVSFDDNHLFEILQFAKFGIASINSSIVMVLKLPILYPTHYNHTKIYPVPDNKSIILVPPTSHHLESLGEEKWVENCFSSSQQTICQGEHVTECSLKGYLKHCTTAYADKANAYKLLSNGILTTFSKPEEIIEKCQSTITRFLLQNSNLLLPECEVIIENNIITPVTKEFQIPQIRNLSTYNLQPQKGIALQPVHLEDVSSLKEDLYELQKEEHLLGTPVAAATHLAITTFCIIFIILLICFFVLYRAKFKEFLFKKRFTVKIKASELKKIKDKYLSEDSQNLDGEELYAVNPHT